MRRKNRWRWRVVSCGNTTHCELYRTFTRGGSHVTVTGLCRPVGVAGVNRANDRDDGGASRTARRYVVQSGNVVIQHAYGNEIRGAPER